MKTSAHFKVVKDGDTQSDQRYLCLCIRHKTPYILIKLKNSKADVEWDYISLPSKMDHIWETNKNSIKEKALEIIKQHNYPGITFSVGSAMISIRNLPIESAECVAEAIYQLVIDLLPKKIIT